MTNWNPPPKPQDAALHEEILAGDPVAKNVAKEQARKIGLTEADIKLLFGND
jgi:hypothetical protein